MKMLILTEGGKQTGFGHITRCTALAQAASEAFPEFSVKFMVNTDNEEKDCLQRLSTWALDVCDWTENINEILDEVKQSDMILIDSYLAKREAYYEISEIADKKFVMIDDCGRIDYPAGIVVNPSPGAGGIKYAASEDIEYLLGKEYTILRKEFWVVPKKRINEEIKEMLISLGGTADEIFIERVKKELNARFSFRVNIVGKEKINASGMRSLMMDSDICLSAGGQTLFELARAGLPTVCVEFAENQKYNIEGLRQAGFLEYAGSIEDDDVLEKMIKGIENMIPQKTREERSRVGRSIVDGEGAVRIVESVSRIYGIEA